MIYEAQRQISKLTDLSRCLVRADFLFTLGEPWLRQGLESICVAACKIATDNNLWGTEEFEIFYNNICKLWRVGRYSPELSQ